MQNQFEEWHLRHILQRGNMNKLLSFSLLFSLLFAKDSFNITGVVINSQGDGIKKANLILTNPDGDEIKETKSKGKGKFKFKKIEPGDYILSGYIESDEKGKINFTIIDEDIELELILLSQSDNPSIPGSIQKDIPKIAIDNFQKAPKKKKTLPILIPQQKEQTEKTLLKFEKTFFEYDANLKALKTEIDSLKSVVKGYQKNQSMPNVSHEILDLIPAPIYQHRIELQNGTVVSGDIIEESDSSLVIKTQIGTLVLKKEMVVRMDEFHLPAPKVIFLGEPFIDYYPDRQIFSGQVKNEGEIRADFVRVLSSLFDQTTQISGMDSTFVKGTRIVYKTNVVSDTALKPGQIANYELTVPILKGKKVQYHTMDIHWNQTR